LRHQSGEIEQGRIRELRSGHVPDAGEDRLDPPRKFNLPRAQHAFDRRSLQVGLRTAEAAGNEGKLPRCRITLDITMWRPSSLLSFGGIALRRPPKNMFKNKVSTMSSR
jgi:hypothetical protein